MSTTMISIGMMQGRLSNKPRQPLQSFPIHTWAQEFTWASELGFHSIEWLVDGVYDEHNPLFSEAGRQEIREVRARHQISTPSLCAHGFMSGELLGTESEATQAIAALVNVAQCAQEIGVQRIVVPAMENMSLQSEKSRHKMAGALNEILKHTSLSFALETDLDSTSLLAFITKLDTPRVGVLYDVGNANAMGFNLAHDVEVLEQHIQEIHIKDRNRETGGSGRLGMQGTDFKPLTEWLQQKKWVGPLVLETPIMSDWKAEATHNIEFTRRLFEQELSQT